MKIARNVAASGRSGEWYQPFPAPSLRELARPKGVTEGVSFDGCSGPMVIRTPLLALKFLSFYVHRSTLPQSATLTAPSRREPGRAAPFIRVLANIRGWRAIFIAPTVGSIDAKKPRLLARLFVLCWHYLSSRQVTLQVLSAQMSLTAVFGMGTGGPSSQSIPTMSDEVLPHPLLCQSPRSALTSSFLLASCEKLVTRTGFEPMLKA